jgi:WD40 repeat protein
LKTDLAIPSALAWSMVPIGPKSPATTNVSPGRLYAACSDKSVKVFTPGGKLVTNLWGHSDWVTSVAISPDGRKLATGSADGTVKLWNPIQYRLVATLIRIKPDSEAWAFITELGFSNTSSPDLIQWKPPGQRTTPEDLNRRFLNPEAVRITLNALRPPPGPRPASDANHPKDAASVRTKESAK